MQLGLPSGRCEASHRMFAILRHPASAVTRREVQVQQEKIRTAEFSVQIQTIDEGYDGLAIWDHAQVAMDFGIAQRLAHHADFSRVVFGES
jgi:hypothetical protein